MTARNADGMVVRLLKGAGPNTHVEIADIFSMTPPLQPDRIAQGRNMTVNDVHQRVASPIAQMVQAPAFSIRRSDISWRLPSRSMRSCDLIIYRRRADRRICRIGRDDALDLDVLDHLV